MLHWLGGFLKAAIAAASITMLLACSRILLVAGWWFCCSAFGVPYVATTTVLES
jgi:hypothetical protein